ncbi:MAG: hypothetical protein ABIR62_06785 [Dokdonella sp.]|uniref:hypothetical protein n=1 Tax=Dokdonella sp. TaxID=2291710 RepID=UPI0032643A65
MLVKFVLATVSIAAAAALIPAARADTLDVQPAKTPHRHARHHHVAEGGNVPSRGMSMGQVERRFGAPIDKLPSAGGDAPRHPTINRWRYNGYTVYFERSHVIHSVMDATAPTPAS